MIWRGIVGAVVGVLIFALGVGVGNGQVSFGTTSANANRALPANLDYSSVEQVYDLLKTNYDGKLNEAKLLDGLKAGLSKATGDPYTQYFNEQEAKDFTDELNGSFSGIGAQLGENDSHQIIIVSPIEGFPASKAGLRPQDVIATIDGQITADMSIDEAVNKIRGPKDTKVTLGILRGKSQDLVNLTITRDDIKIPSVKWEMLDGQVGSIQVSQFGDDTTDLVTKAAHDLRAQGARSILLDLRSDPGGLLTSAIDMASLVFLIIRRLLGLVIRQHIRLFGAGAA